MKKIILSFLLIFTVGVFGDSLKDNQKLIPSTCNTLIGIDMTQIMTIPQVKALLSNKENEKIKELYSLGMGPEDVVSVIIGMDNSKLQAGVNITEPPIIAISTMKSGVSLETILETAKKDKVEITEKEVNGAKVYVMKKDGNTMSMTKLSDTSIAVGSNDLIAKSIMLKNGVGDSLATNKSITELVAGKKSVFWAVGIIPKPAAPKEDAPLDNPQLEMMKKIRSFTFDAKYNKDMILDLQLVCEDPTVASQIAVMAQFGIAAMTAQQGSPIQANMIKIHSKEKSMFVNVTLNEGLLNMLPLMLMQK